MMFIRISYLVLFDDVFILALFRYNFIHLRSRLDVSTFSTISFPFFVFVSSFNKN